MYLVCPVEIFEFYGACHNSLERARTIVRFPYFFFFSAEVEMALTREFDLCTPPSAPGHLVEHIAVSWLGELTGSGLLI